MGHTDRPGPALDHQGSLKLHLAAWDLGRIQPRLSQRMGMTAPQHHHDTKNRLEVSSFFYKIVSENMVNLWSTKRMFTLWLFNIAMENGPFIDGLPIKDGDFPWLC